MKIPIGLILLGLSLELHAGGTVFTNPAAAQSEINLLPERHMIVFRHGIRADNHFRETHPDVTRDDWVRYVDEHRLGWELHNPGLAAQQVELEASIRSLLALQVRPTVIIASPYLRSIETALIIQRSFPGIEIVVDRRLSEWSYAAFGIHSDPFVHVPAPESFRDITPAWNPAILETEMMEASGHAYVQRVRDVLTELALNHDRPIVVGHLHTVTAAYPTHEHLQTIAQGGYIIGTATNTARLHTLSGILQDRIFTVYHRFSRGVTILPQNATQSSQQ